MPPQRNMPDTGLIMEPPMPNMAEPWMNRPQNMEPRMDMQQAQRPMIGMPQPESFEPQRGWDRRQPESPEMDMGQQNMMDPRMQMQS